MLAIVAYVVEQWTERLNALQALVLIQGVVQFFTNEQVALPLSTRFCNITLP